MMWFRNLLLLGSLVLSATIARGQKDDVDNKAGPSEDLARIMPAYDPGCHTKPISALGFTTDRKKLVTVGQDCTIQVWSTATGERLEVLRVPGFAWEKEYSNNRWDFAAISPDGSKVAIGGGYRNLVAKEFTVRMLLIDVPTRAVRRVSLGINSGQLTAFAFSPDGQRLAIGREGEIRQVFVLENVHQAFAANGPQPGIARVAFESGLPQAPTVLAFAPDSRRLLVADSGKSMEVWDVPRGKKKAGPTRLVHYEGAGSTTALAWAPDGKRFARATLAVGKLPRQLELIASDGKQSKVWGLEDFAPVFTARSHIASLQFLDANRLYLSGYKQDGDEARYPAAAALDLANGQIAPGFSGEPMLGAYYPFGTVSADGELAATSVSMGLEATIYTLKRAQKDVHCGALTPIPTFVGWSADGKAPGFAWSEKVKLGQFDAEPDALAFGFDLLKVEPMSAVNGAGLQTSILKHGEWTLRPLDKDGVRSSAIGILQNDKETVQIRRGSKAASGTLIPRNDGPPLIGCGTVQAFSGARFASSAWVFSSDGAPVAQLRPAFPFVRDMTASPDGKFLIVSTGSHRLAIYATNGSPFPLLNFVSVRGEWVIWTQEGYYAASPGGEKLLGWAVNTSWDAPAEFLPAERLAKHFRRPDVIRMTIEKGSVAEALKALEATGADVEKLLTPKATLSLVRQDGAKIRVKASAAGGAKDKPVLAMRVLLDGRPLSEGRGALTVESGKPAEAEWDVEIPSGTHELKLMARNDDGPFLSEPITVTAPKEVGQQPTLHRICIGINQYDDRGLELKAAAKDAQEVFDALELNCVGTLNRFGAAKGRKIIDKEATRGQVLHALDEVRKLARPGDLVVVFFAGHGVKQEDDFYLLTKEADLTKKSLKGISLSGEDLRQAFAKVECPVLLVLDACHSAKAVKALRPATDDLTRHLTDDAAGVTVMAAAMAHEVAGANTENGHFTAALLKALKVGDGVPFDPYERQLYTHHIYSVVFSEVRKATGGKQNPFLNSPWTVPPLAVREVPRP